MPTQKAQQKGWPLLRPALYYRDTGKALPWLRNAFGFRLTEHELLLESSGPRTDAFEPYARIAVFSEQPGHRASPASMDGVNTQSLVVFVDDVEAHYAGATAAGATIVSDVELSDHGELGDETYYECLDLEGHLWRFAQHMGEEGVSPDSRERQRVASLLYYEDAAFAGEWLRRAFGFEIQTRPEPLGGRAARFELTFGGGRILVADEAPATGKWPRRASPRSIGGTTTQETSVWEMVSVKAHCKRAIAAGATITFGPTGGGLTTVQYAANDLGGHRWMFSQVSSAYYRRG